MQFRTFSTCTMSPYPRFKAMRALHFPTGTEKLLLVKKFKKRDQDLRTREFWTRCQLRASEKPFNPMARKCQFFLHLQSQKGIDTMAGCLFLGSGGQGTLFLQVIHTLFH